MKINALSKFVLFVVANIKDFNISFVSDSFVGINFLSLI